MDKACMFSIKCNYLIVFIFSAVVTQHLTVVAWVKVCRSPQRVDYKGDMLLAEAVLLRKKNETVCAVDFLHVMCPCG